MPHSYACAAHFAVTKQLSTNNTFAVLGSSFPTAFTAFQKVFKTKTDIQGGQRVEFGLRKKEVGAAAKAAGVRGSLNA